MALSDTAALVASLELQDKFSATANKFDRTIGGMERQMSTFGRISGQVSAGIGQASQNLQRIGLIGVGVLTANVAAGIATIARLEEVTAATNAVIESTGGVAGISAQRVRDLAEEYENLNATMDDKVIQSAENLLLTFTSINEKAFEPALEAALNMNQAMGGGEEGLQGTIIQLGKALQDPIRGLTALRRVGVNFTSAQQEQIKALVEANDLYAAQQIILQELGREFGGQFAAAGETATARFARFKDAIEDAQVALATALLPVLEKVTGKLTEFLEDPKNLRVLEEVGVNLADAFDSIVEIAGNLPWEAIGDSFRLMGTGAKALLTAFTSLPPWVQTAVLTGWGLNKLTGGALGSIVGALASGLIKGILGINAGVVNINAATVNGGGGVPATAARGAALAGLGTFVLGVGAAAALGATLGAVIAAPIFQATVAPAREFEKVSFDDRTTTNIEISRRNLDAVNSGLEQLTGINQETGEKTGNMVGQLGNVFDKLAALVTGQTSTEAILLEQQAILEKEAGLADTLLDKVESGTSKITGEIVTDSRISMQNALARARDEAQTRQQARSDALSQISQLSAQNMKLQAIQGKDFSPTVRVTSNITSNVSITDITRRLVSQRIAVSGTGGITIE